MSALCTVNDKNKIDETSSNLKEVDQLQESGVYNYWPGIYNSHSKSARIQMDSHRFPKDYDSLTLKNLLL